MKPSPLQLDRSSVGNLTLRVADRGVAVPDELEIEVVPSFGRHNENPLRWLVGIKVTFGRSGDKPVPYEGEIEYDGVFTIIDESLPEEMQLRLIAITGPSILYSSAREIIASLTARATNGVFLLPSVSFTDQQLVPLKAEEKPIQSRPQIETVSSGQQQPNE